MKINTFKITPIQGDKGQIKVKVQPKKWYIWYVYVVVLFKFFIKLIKAN